MQHHFSHMDVFHEVCHSGDHVHYFSLLTSGVQFMLQQGFIDKGSADMADDLYKVCKGKCMHNIPRACLLT